jgi:hypothetical protein
MILQELAEEIAASSLPASVSTRLRGRIGYELTSLDRLDEARKVFAPLAREDVRLSDVTLQCAYAHTLIRSNSDDRESRLIEAERLLKALLDRGPNPEASGLLGSAAKVLAQLAFMNGHDRRAMIRYARDAADAYEAGFRGDPRAYYPGVNAVALRRLLGQRLDPRGGKSNNDLELAREMLPAVRFVVRSALSLGDSSIWTQVTDAELDLHEYLLTDPDPEAEAPESLVRAMDELCRKTRTKRQPRKSLTRQLELMRDTGDPPTLLDQLISCLNS